MNLKRNRLLMWTAVAVAVALGLAYAFWPRALAVDMAEVERGELLVTIEEEGETRIRDIYIVSAPVAGRVARIEADEGDAVVAGETVVAAIHPVDPTLLDQRSQAEREAAVRVAEAAVGLAEAELARAKAELDFAVADLRRATQLERGSTISERALERYMIEEQTRRAAHTAARAALAMRRSELETARAALIVPGPGAEISGTPCCVQIRAPVSGQVLRVLHESEGVAAMGTPLIEIGDPENLEVVVDLLSEDAVRVNVGDTVLIEEWGGGAPLEGRVRRIEPFGFTKVSALGIEEQRVNVIIDFASPLAARRRLGHGFRVDVRIVTWRGEDVLKVPLSAVFREGSDWAAFVVNSGRAHARKIEIGRRDARYAEVLSGLDVGQLVIIHPSEDVNNGVRVEARD